MKSLQTPAIAFWLVLLCLALYQTKFVATLFIHQALIGQSLAIYFPQNIYLPFPLFHYQVLAHARSPKVDLNNS